VYEEGLELQEEAVRRIRWYGIALGIGPIFHLVLTKIVIKRKKLNVNSEIAYLNKKSA